MEDVTDNVVSYIVGKNRIKYVPPQNKECLPIWYRYVQSDGLWHDSLTLRPLIVQNMNEWLDMTTNHSIRDKYVSEVNTKTRRINEVTDQLIAVVSDPDFIGVLNRQGNIPLCDKIFDRKSLTYRDYSPEDYVSVKLTRTSTNVEECDPSGLYDALVSSAGKVGADKFCGFLEGMLQNNDNFLALVNPPETLIKVLKMTFESFVRVVRPQFVSGKYEGVKLMLCEDDYRLDETELPECEMNLLYYMNNRPKEYVIAHFVEEEIVTFGDEPLGCESYNERTYLSLINLAINGAFE